MARVIITFCTLLLIIAAIFVAICYSTDHTELLPEFLQPEVAVEQPVPAPSDVM